MAVMQPPRRPRRGPSSGEIWAICASVSQPVALTTKQPLSNHVVFSRGGGCRVGDRAGDNDGIVVAMDIVGAAEHGRTDEEKIGIPRHEGLGKHGKPCSLHRRVNDLGKNAVERSRRRIQVGRDLHRGEDCNGCAN